MKSSDDLPEFDPERFLHREEKTGGSSSKQRLQQLIQVTQTLIQTMTKMTIPMMPRMMTLITIRIKIQMMTRTMHQMTTMTMCQRVILTLELSTMTVVM